MRWGCWRGEKGIKGPLDVGDFLWEGCVGGVFLRGKERLRALQETEFERPCGVRCRFAAFAQEIHETFPRTIALDHPPRIRHERFVDRGKADARKVHHLAEFLGGE